MRSINRLLIRCDASSTIGTGHLMRSLVLAKRLDAVNTVFAMRNLEGNLTDRVQQEGFDVSILQTDEITELIEVITNLKADAVVIDHYDIDVDQERQIREATSVFLIVLDDACARHYADLLINHNIYAREEDYKGLVPDFTRFWCGQEHALLREEFLSARGLEKTRHEIPQVVIAMGGADTQNISIPVAKEVLKHTNANVHILSTSANANLAGLKNFASRNDAVQLHIDSREVARLIRNADLAIISASSIFNEVIYLETPLIAIKTVDNQRHFYQFARNNGYAALDGFEATRLQYLLEYMFAKCELHDFTTLNNELLKKILLWRNHPDVKKWMLNQQTISWGGHKRFVADLKYTQDKRYLLCQCNGVSKGVVSFINIGDANAVLGLYAIPGIKGAGKYLMNSGIAYARDHLKLHALRVEVFEGNTSARLLYLSFGFRVINQESRYGHKLIIMEKHL